MSEHSRHMFQEGFLRWWRAIRMDLGKEDRKNCSPRLHTNSCLASQACARARVERKSSWNSCCKQELAEQRRKAALLALLLHSQPQEDHLSLTWSGFPFFGVDLVLALLLLWWAILSVTDCIADVVLTCTLLSWVFATADISTNPREMSAQSSCAVKCRMPFSVLCACIHADTYGLVASISSRIQQCSRHHACTTRIRICSSRFFYVNVPKV